MHARRTQNLLVGWAKWCPKVEDILPGCEIDRERKRSGSPGLMEGVSTSASTIVNRSSDPLDPTKDDLDKRYNLAWISQVDSLSRSGLR